VVADDLVILVINSRCDGLNLTTNFANLLSHKRPQP
jgi:hypothetical protein